MKKTIILGFLFITSFVFSQGEANIWYFGDQAGLDFNSGVPVALTNSQMFTHEGCAVLSNGAGQLLFYTDGVTIWNKNQQIMLNGTGLMGNFSSTQSAIIVPKPGSSTLFYVFTTDYEGNSNGLRYSIIDLSLDGGLGGVTTTKNILLYTPSCEKLTVVKHANNVDFWIISHGWNNNNYYSYLLDSNGVNPTPIISSIGALIPLYYVATSSSASGVIKISPDGSKLVSILVSPDSVELFDYNTSTGVVSNPQQLTNHIGFLYGAEFSTDNSVLYITSDGEIIQYDLKANPISSSAYVVNNNDHSSTPASLQLGPDNKIYVSLLFSPKIAVINQPNVLGVGCNFLNSSIDLGGKICRSGLPAFVQSFFVLSEIKYTNSCLGDTTSFSLNNSQTITSATWDFGDGNTSNVINPTHTYASAGKYSVGVTATGASGSGIKTKDIIISAVPTATKPNDLFICDTNNDGLYNFDLTTQNVAILNGQDPNLYAVNYYANATDYANNVAIATPNNYVNAIPYQQQTIVAEVSNKANTVCKSTTNFNIGVFDLPKPSLPANIPKISICDNTSVGTDTDGHVVFDLTQNQTIILNGQSASQFILSYYKDSAMSQLIATPATYQNTNTSETIYVKMVNKDNLNCFAITSFQIEVLALPIITSVVNLKQCDDNQDGFSAFNLEEAIDKITTNAANETIVFFKSQADAQNNTNPISNTTAYTNQIVNNDVVYVKVTNSNGCFRTAQLNLIVSTTQIPLNFANTFTQCDDAILGTNTDGIASFDFSSVTNQVQAIFPVGQLLDITYYRNLADALAEKNAITDISNYRNIGYPNTQNIYIRVDSRVNNDCLGLGSYITLNVEKIPIVKPIVINHCDDNQDGKYAFDTTNLESQLLNGLTNVTVSYFDQNNVLLQSPLPNPFNTKSQTLKVVATNNTPTACSYNSTLQFVVDVLPQAFLISTALTTICDDEADPSLQDGKYAFDTSSFENTILGTQTGMIVNYFDGNNNSLSSPLPNPFVTSTQNVKVEVINPINTACTATFTLPFIVNPVPKISLLGNELVCSNLPTFIKVLDAGLLDGSPTSNYSYLWSFNGTPLAGETNYTLTVNTAGLYTVKVTNNQGCSRTRTITVTASDIAKITAVTIVDLAESNSISVTVTGSGDYVYGLDDEYGTYQKESVFTNVTAGIHTVFIKDLNGCGVVPKEVSVLGIPNFFTPNNDGYNDYWNIKGLNTSFNSKTIIYIFDRYGKLISQISPTGQGWDGKFNEQPMPATDYWYSVQLEDGRVVKGHFSLKR